MPEPTLAQLQRWMSLVIAHPDDAAAAASGDAARALIPDGAVLQGEVIKPSATMTPLARLDVYNGGYLTRLIEVLESDYDALRYALGREGWLALAKDYVYAHPSEHPNLIRFGARLPAFVAARAHPHAELLAELAALQWAVTEAFHAPAFTPLDLAPLRALTQKQWADVVLTTNPSLRLLRCTYPVNGFLQAFWDGSEPALPAPHPTHIAVYRKDERVWRVRLPPPIFAILAALRDGQPFARALEAGGEHHEDVGRWFQDWSADGLFVAAHTPAG